MKILFWGSIIFCSALSVHLAIWKVRIPKAQTKVLLQIFLAALIIYLVSLWLIPSSVIILDNYAPKKISEYLHIALFFISLTIAYLTTYSALEVDSPTLLMVINIAKVGSEGLGKERLKQIMTDELLIKPRVDDLLTDKVIYLDGNRYKLTWRGFLITRIFIFYRKLLCLQKSG